MFVVSYIPLNLPIWPWPCVVQMLAKLKGQSEVWRGPALDATATVLKQILVQQRKDGWGDAQNVFSFMKQNVSDDPFWHSTYSSDILQGGGGSDPLNIIVWRSSHLKCVPTFDSEEEGNTFCLDALSVWSERKCKKYSSVFWRFGGLFCVSFLFVCFLHPLHLKDLPQLTMVRNLV